MKKTRNSLKILGQQIRTERKSRGLTQLELGRFSGTAINFISELERGKATLRMDKVLDVLRVLGLQLRIEYGKQEIIK
jgi:y4mF family transcriptional regulator